MEDLKTAAWMLRYGARSLAHNLEFIPADREDWTPKGAKSPLAVAQEVIRALQMYRPIFDGPEMTYPQLPPPPTTLAEARSRLLAVAEEYAAALEAAGPELDRPQEMPFGGVFRAYRAVCFPVMDLFHHHGQVCYMQSILGDRETHWNAEAITAEFAWPESTSS
jgi:hypothetical protein